MKVALRSGEGGLLLVSAIQKESIQMYYSHLSAINFDDTIDNVPEKESNKDDVPMESPQKPMVRHSPKNK
jgi:hypothetical protein